MKLTAWPPDPPIFRETLAHMVGRDPAFQSGMVTPAPGDPVVGVARVPGATWSAAGNGKVPEFVPR